MNIFRVLLAVGFALLLSACNSGNDSDGRAASDASGDKTGASQGNSDTAVAPDTAGPPDNTPPYNSNSSGNNAGFEPDAIVVSGYQNLLTFISERDELNKGNKNALNKKVENSKRQYMNGRVCPASNMLNAFLNQSAAFRNTRYPGVGNDLYYMGQLLIQDMAASLGPDNDRNCPKFEGLGDEPVIEVVHSDNQRIAGHVSFGAPLQQSIHAGGEDWINFVYPGFEPGVGMSDGTNIGAPKIPVIHRLVAIPVGAEPVLSFQIGSQTELNNINAYPLQPSPVDDDSLPPSETFATPPFEKDVAAYQQDALYPPDPIMIREIGQMRDLRLLQISFMPMQYNPVMDTAVLNDDFDFEVAYEGGTGKFISEQSLSPFESMNQRVIQSGILNIEAAYEFTYRPDIVFPQIGAELVIITDPDFIDAANDLADWKRDKGISTIVETTGAESEGGIGTTKEQIKSYLQDKYDSSLIRLSYVLLLGDAEFIPPYYRSSSGSSTTGTDLDYSLLAGTDLLADIGVGRIPVDTAEQAQTVIDKIIDYEKTPPLFATNFYQTASFPAYFQCCRTDVTQIGTTERAYIETMEQIRNAMIGQGKTVERLYFSDTTYEGSYTSDTTPRRYFNGTLLPSDLGAGSGFVWDAGQQDVIDSFNEGRFLVIHRDHGGENGWVFPALASSAVTNLDNGSLLPVLFSVDCATGLFDNETAGGDYSTSNSGIYLLERMLRESDGGVVGALGDTRNSPTWANNALTRGFSDAVFPTVMGSYGTGNSIRRLADILNYGKLYMFTQVGVSQTAGSVSQTNADSNNIMWHAFGDPTQEIWTSQPFFLPPDFIKILVENGIKVQYAVEGAVITALQNGLPLGRGVVENGEAILQYEREPDPNAPVKLSASAEGAVGVLLTPETGAPDLMARIVGPKSAFPGQSLDDVIDIAVNNLGDADAQGSVDANGNPTGGGYVIDIVLSSDTVVPPGFAPASTTFQEDALLVGGRISRTPAVAAGESVLLSSDPPINSDIGGTIAPDTPPGEYNLCLRIDPGDGIAESDETNNVYCWPIVISPPLN